MDWKRLTFHSSITDKVLFGNNVLKGQYIKRGGQVRDFYSITRKLELALEWFERYHNLAEVQSQLLSWMVHICLQQFRIDVLQSMKKDILPEHHEALTGKEPLCWDYLTTITGSKLYLVSKNKSLQTPSKFASYLFDFDGRKRQQWENRPFRKLYQRARIGLNLTHGRQIGRKFSKQLWKDLFRYHWILPYPSPGKWIHRAKQRGKWRRIWYSIAEGEGGDWEWAKEDYQRGYPEGFPRYLTWTKEEWEDWLRRNGADVDVEWGDEEGRIGGVQLGSQLEEEVSEVEEEEGVEDEIVEDESAEEMAAVTRRSSRIAGKEQRKIREREIRKIRKREIRKIKKIREREIRERETREREIRESREKSGSSSSSSSSSRLLGVFLPRYTGFSTQSNTGHTQSTSRVHT
jgi:hypothetical protein